MATLTTTLQGSFIGTGLPVFIPMESGVTWITTLNQTAASAGANVGLGYQFQWQLGMGQGLGYAYSNPAVPIFAPLAAGTGFYYTDTSIITTTKSPNPVTNISNATPPVVTSNAHGLVTGNIVRLVSTLGARQLDGIDYYITRTGANTFQLTYQIGVATAAAPGAAAAVYLVSGEGIYVPLQRVITNITQANPAVITFAAPHQFTPGQEVRIKVPVSNTGANIYGMTQMNNLVATVLAINTTPNSISVNIDSTGFTAWTFPTDAQFANTNAQVVPIGEDTATANTLGVDPLGDAVNNIAQTGMTLQPGVLSPAGQAADQIFWMAGTVFSVNNAF
jgi:hypothetical protein